MTNKMLFDAVEAELRNARVALNNAGAYIDTLKDAVVHTDTLKDVVKETVSSSGMEEADLIVKIENGEYGIPLAIEPGDEILIYGCKIRGVNKRLEEHLKLL